MCYNPRLKSILLKNFNTDILNLGGGRWYLVHWTGVTFVGSWASCTMEEAIPFRPFLPLPCAVHSAGTYQDTSHVDRRPLRRAGPARQPVRLRSTVHGARTPESAGSVGIQCLWLWTVGWMEDRQATWFTLTPRRPLLIINLLCKNLISSVQLIIY